VRLRVDADECTGHGRCYRIAPDLLSYDDEGYVSIRGEEIAIPADMADVAEELEGTCPEGAIILIED
jgi:ferredoxin